MSPAVDQHRPAVLLGVLTLAAAGPLVAADLPGGPASLLTPKSVAVLAAALAMLHALLVWPLSARSRGGGETACSGAAILLLSLPFVAGPSLVWGGSLEEVAGAAALLAGTLLVAGAWLTGPGRDRGRDRFFVAGAVALLFVVPFANWIVNELGGIRGGLGYRISPILAARDLLLGRSGADPRPALLVLVGTAGILFSGRLAGRGTAAAVLILLAAAARAEEPTVAPLLGDAYVPGRLLPLVVRAGGARRVWVRVEGRGRFGAPGAAEGAVVAVPAGEALSRVDVREGDGGAWVPRELALRPARRLLAVLGPVTSDLAARAREAGFTASRAEAGAARADPRSFLAADAVLDPGGLLRSDAAAALRAAGVPVLARPEDLTPATGARLLRPPWEQAGGILGAEALWRLFPPEAGYDRSRAARSFVALAAFALVAFALLRFTGRRGTGPVARTALLAAATVAAMAALAALLPRVPEVREARVVLREGSRRVTITRLRAVRDGVAPQVWDEAPLLLGEGGAAMVAPAPDGRWRMVLRMEAHRMRVVVETGFAEPPPESPFDLLVSPEGIARPGGEPVGPGEFLAEGGVEAPFRERVLRKLLRIGEPPGRFGVRFAGPEGRTVEVVRLGK